MPNFTNNTASAVSPIRLPATLREAVVEQLRAAIITGELEPGAVLKDAELAKQLGTSATPVREALVQLAAEGLIEIKPNCLKRVAIIDLSAIVELLEVQNHLWGLGYAWGAPHIGSNELNQLRHIYKEHAAAVKSGSLNEAIQAALAFHRVLMIASGNRELLRVSLDRLSLIQRFVRLYAPQLVSSDMLEQHHNMIETLAKGDVSQTLKIYKKVSSALVEEAKRLRDSDNKERLSTT